MSALALKVGLGAVLGAILASYAVTAAMRYARAESSTSGRSHCDSCGRGLSYLHTVPILSYLALRGSCADCGAAIDRLHPVGELAGVGLAAAAAIAAPPVQAVAVMVLGLLLLAAAVVDLKVRRLPNAISLAVLVLGLGLAAARSWTDLAQGGVAAALTFSLLEGLRRGFLHLRREPGLGQGDVKLLAALAAWVGPATPWMVVGAALLGLAYVVVARPADRRIAFGPMIAIAGWSVGLLREGGWWPIPI